VEGLRTTRITPAALAAVLGAFCAASCVQGPEEESKAPSAPSRAPLGIQAEDGDDTRADVDAAVGSEPPFGAQPFEGDVASESDWFTYRVCVLLKASSRIPRAAFCLSQPDGGVRGRCFSHLLDSPTSWATWCYNEFAE
jgi:hypothetical protein